jgi:hypothetical protein
MNASKSKQQQQATQQASGWTNAGSASYGGSQQDVWGGQVPALQSLYGNAQALLGDPGQMTQGFGQTMGQGVNAWAGALQPGKSPYFDASLTQAIDAATRGFTQNVLPSLQDAGIRAGAVGSPRAQLAQGQAAGMFGQDLQNMVAQMANQQYGMDRQLQGQALAMTPAMAGSWFQPLAQAAQAIGGPTVLGQSQNASQSFAQGANQSTGQSSGSGSSKGFGLGLGK